MRALAVPARENVGARVTALCASPRAALCAFLFLLMAAPEAAARAVLVKAKQSTPQFDEAIAAFKSEFGGDVVEVAVDEATSAAALQERVLSEDAGVVVTVGARAALLAASLDRPVVACMLLQASAVPARPKLVKVAVAVPARSQLDALRALVPSAKAVGVLYDPRFNATEVQEFKAAADILKIKLITQSVSDQRETPAALDAMLSQMDALVLPADATVVSKAFLQYLVKRAFDKKLPVLTYSESFVRLGLLAALVPSYADNGRIAGRIAKRVLEGIAPAELQASAVMKGALVVNKAAGAKMGLTLPARMLSPPTLVVGE